MAHLLQQLPSRLRIPRRHMDRLGTETLREPAIQPTRHRRTERPPETTILKAQISHTSRQSATVIMGRRTE